MLTSGWVGLQRKSELLSVAMKRCSMYQRLMKPEAATYLSLAYTGGVQAVTAASRLDCLQVYCH